jgi:hypothetical protein
LGRVRGCGLGLDCGRGQIGGCVGARVGTWVELKVGVGLVVGARGRFVVGVRAGAGVEARAGVALQVNSFDNFVNINIVLKVILVYLLK